MELKTIVAIGLVLFIVAGLVFLYMRKVQFTRDYTG